jgi:hypothetical protein
LICFVRNLPGLVNLVRAVLVQAFASDSRVIAAIAYDWGAALIGAVVRSAVALPGFKDSSTFNSVASGL